MQKHDDRWTKEPEVKIKRVFRTTNVAFEQDKRILVTVNRQEGTINGTTVRPLLVKKTFNHAGQYILRENEQEYLVQLKALRRAEKSGKVLEVDPTWDGKPFVPKPPPDEKDKRIKELEAEIEAHKASDTVADTPVKSDGGKGDGAKTASTELK